MIFAKKLSFSAKKAGGVVSNQKKYDLQNIPRIFDFPYKVLEFGWLPNHSHQHNNDEVDGGFICLGCNYLEQSVLQINNEVVVREPAGLPFMIILMPGTVLTTIKPARHDEIFFRYSSETMAELAKFFGITAKRRFKVEFQGFPTEVLAELSNAAANIDKPGSADRIDILAIRLFSEVMLRKIESGSGRKQPDVKLNTIACELAAGRPLDKLLKEYGLSERSFYRQWQQTFEVSPKEYIIRSQLKKACSLLADGNTAIGDIAAACGFVNTNYFYKIFRKKLNITPGEYRKKCAGKLFAAVGLPDDAI